MDTYALLVWRSSKYRYLLFFLLTLLVLFIYGYYFGTFDQASHIPFLKKTADPTLFPNDRYFDLNAGHFSYFWLLFIPLYRMGVLEVSMFIVHVLTIYTTFWALWRLSKVLFNSPLTSLLVVISSIVPHFGFSSLPLFEFSLLNRTVMLPFELFVLEQYLKRNYLRVFIILGILYNFHILSVNFILAMIVFDMIFSLRSDKVKVQKIVQCIPLFVICALPVLVWKATHSGIDFTAHYEWFAVLNKSLLPQMFSFVSVNFPIVKILTLSGLSAFLIFFTVFPKEKNTVHETMRNFIYAGIFIILVQLGATYIYPSTIIIQSQIIRIGVFVMLFTYFYFANYIASLPNHNHPQYRFLLLVFIFSFYAFIPLIGLSIKKWVTTNKRMYLLSALTLIIFIGAIVGVVKQNAVRPGIYIWPEKTPFNEVQLWAKNNTPKDTLFITPPTEWWLYSSEWRVLSERSTVSVLSELLEAAFDPSYLPYWKSRFEDVAPGALSQFKGNIHENRVLAESAYYSNSTEDFILLGKKYNASYLVTNKKNTYNLPIIFENSSYSVFSLTYPTRE